MEELSAKEQGPISTKLLEVMPTNSDDHFIELVIKRLQGNPYDGTNKSKFIPTKKHVSYKELLKVAKLPIRPKLKRGFMEFQQQRSMPPTQNFSKEQNYL
jgi:hypothetical protein